MEKKMTNKAVIYVRVSTADQVDNMSLANQEEKCRTYCASVGLEVVGFFREEGASAKTTARPQLTEMLNYLGKNAKREQITAVVVYKIDRFSRRMEDFHALKAKLHLMKVDLHSATEMFDDSPAGNLHVNVLASFAQFDNEQRAQRTREGMRATLLTGRWVWRPPIGYEKGEAIGPSMRVNPEMAQLVRNAFLRVGSGEQKKKVRIEMARIGLIGVTGVALTPARFDAMLQNPLYKGRILLPEMGIDVPGDWEPIVTEEEWELAQVRRNAKGTKKRQRLTPDFPLRSTVLCSGCGKYLTASKSKGRKESYGYYWCWNPHCKAVSVRREVLEETYGNYLTALSMPIAILDLFEETMMDEWKQRQAHKTSLREAALKKRNIAQQRLDNLMNRFLDGSIEEAVFKIHRQRYQEDIDNLAHFQYEKDRDPEVLRSILRQGRFLLSDLQGTWNQLNRQQKPRFAQVLHPEGLTTDGISIRTADTPWFNKAIDILNAEEHRLAAQMDVGLNQLEDWLNRVADLANIAAQS
jgi:site-specific DNA recombinase